MGRKATWGMPVPSRRASYTGTTGSLELISRVVDRGPMAVGVKVARMVQLSSKPRVRVKLTQVPRVMVNMEELPPVNSIELMTRSLAPALEMVKVWVRDVVLTKTSPKSWEAGSTIMAGVGVRADEPK